MADFMLGKLHCILHDFTKYSDSPYLFLTSCHSPHMSSLSLPSNTVCSWEVNRRLNMLNPANNVSGINTVGTEQEICSALPWICFFYLYIGDCFHSHTSSLSVQPPLTVLNSWGVRWVRIEGILYFPTCLLRHRAASAWEWGETSTKESSRTQPSSLVTVRCSLLPVPRSVHG